MFRWSEPVRWPWQALLGFLFFQEPKKKIPCRFPKNSSTVDLNLVDSPWQHLTNRTSNSPQIPGALPLIPSFCWHRPSTYPKTQPRVLRFWVSRDELANLTLSSSDTYRTRASYPKKVSHEAQGHLIYLYIYMWYIYIYIYVCVMLMHKSYTYIYIYIYIISFHYMYMYV